MRERGWEEADAEVASVFDRLRTEVLAGPRADSGNGRGAWIAAREDAERRWWVSADRPFLHGPGFFGRLRGLVLLPLKAVLRKLMRWYVQPLAADQREFNAAALGLLDQISERMEAELDRLGRSIEEVRARVERIPELDDRVARLERARHAPASSPAAPNADTVPLPDYFAFEARMRGSTEDVRTRQERYLDDFRAAAPVLDVGCGRGEFLGLLRQEGIEARGVDIDPDMVAFCRGQGLEVAEADAIAHLEALPEGSLGGVFAAQFVEHLRPGPLVSFLALAASRLRVGGILVVETINPHSVVAMAHYFADLTHAQPLVPAALELLARQSGFARTEVRFLNEPAERLARVELPPEAAFDAARSALADNVERLNRIVFGPQDYALVATR